MPLMLSSEMLILVNNGLKTMQFFGIVVTVPSGLQCSLVSMMMELSSATLKVFFIPYINRELSNSIVLVRVTVEKWVSLVKVTPPKCASSVNFAAMKAALQVKVAPPKYVSPVNCVPMKPMQPVNLALLKLVSPVNFAEMKNVLWLKVAPTKLASTK